MEFTGEVLGLSSVRFVITDLVFAIVVGLSQFLNSSSLSLGSVAYLNVLPSFLAIKVAAM